MKISYRIKTEVNELGERRYTPEIKEGEADYAPLIYQQGTFKHEFKCNLHYTVKSVAEEAINDHIKTVKANAWKEESVEYIKTDDEEKDHTRHEILEVECTHPNIESYGGQIGICKNCGEVWE